MFNNPSNPTGMVYTREELIALTDICVKHDLYIIADEIYYKLLYDGAEFTSIASLGDAVKERTILVNGVSKSYAMTGWRIGYLAADSRITKVIARYLSHSTGNPLFASSSRLCGGPARYSGHGGSDAAGI